MLGVFWAVSRALGAVNLAFRMAMYEVAGLWRYAEDYGWPVLIGCLAFASFNRRVRNALHQRRAERRFVRDD